MAAISTRRGSSVQFDGETMRVRGTAGLDAVILQSSSNRFLTVPLAELAADAKRVVTTVKAPDPIRLAKVPTYKAALADILSPGSRTRAKVMAAGEKLDKSVASIYNALARYDLSQDLNDLPPPTRPGGRGKSRLVAKAETIIATTIDKILDEGRQRRVAYFLTEVRTALAKAGFEVSEATLRARYDDVPWRHRMLKRDGARAAAKLDSKRGDAPTGSRPLEQIQMDHWNTDVEILADDRLTMIGRAWLTVAIDVYTRIIWGWHLGLEHPGHTPMMFCLIRGMTLKNDYLQQIGVAASMPYWGDPQTIHADNANEFRGSSLRDSADHCQSAANFDPGSACNSDPSCAACLDASVALAPA